MIQWIAETLVATTLLMLLVLAMLVYSALFDLDNWSEWVVFGAICATAIGTVIAVNTRS